IIVTQHTGNATATGPAIRDSAESTCSACTSPLYLAFPRFTAQLNHGLNQGPEPSNGATGLSARQLPALGRQRKITSTAQLLVFDKSTTLALFAEPPIFDGHHGNEWIVIIRLEEINIRVRQPGHFQCLGRRRCKARRGDVRQRAGTMVVIVSFPEAS